MLSTTGQVGVIGSAARNGLAASMSTAPTVTWTNAAVGAGTPRGDTNLRR